MTFARFLCMILLALLGCTTCHAFASRAIQSSQGVRLSRMQQHASLGSSSTRLASSFYDDFENFEEDDDEELEEEEEELDDAAIADFRSRMGSLFGEEETVEKEEEKVEEGTMTVDDLISFATSKGSTNDENEKPTEWAKHVDKLEGGVVLLANPAKFCTDMGDKPYTPNPALLAKFGLTLPPPADLGPDRRADLLPVLTLLEKHPLRGSHAVLLNRRTGYLLGDLEQPQQQESDSTTATSTPMPPASSPPPKLGAFMIQPLWFGGTSAGEGMNEGGGGLDMLHQCPTVEGAKQLTPDGLYWGGDPAQAQDAMQDPSLDRVLTGFDFKFFVQSTRWFPLQLEKEVRDGTWFVASVSKEVLFKSRDRMGTRRAKPLWTEIMELMGGKYKDVRDQLYKDDDDE